MHKVVKKLLFEASGFGWDEGSKLVTAPVETWNNYLKNHPEAAQFRSTTFPAYEKMCVLCDGSDATGTFTSSNKAASKICNQPSPGIAQSSFDVPESSFQIPNRIEDEDLILPKDDMGNPSTKCNQPSSLSGRERRRRVGNDMADSLREMASATRFKAEKRSADSQREMAAAKKYSIASCAKELMKFELLGAEVHVLISEKFDNPNIKEMFMTWGTEQRLFWIEKTLRATRD